MATEETFEHQELYKPRQSVRAREKGKVKEDLVEYVQVSLGS